VAAIATRQHGVVSAGQLAALGIDRRRVSRRVQAGRLHRVYRGVFAVGHPVLSKEGRWLAAVGRERSLIVEVDGYRYHGTRAAFEADRARDARLKLLGYDVLRFTHRQLTDHAEGSLATVGALLGVGSG
jgi:hypothetical protein